MQLVRMLVAVCGLILLWVLKGGWPKGFGLKQFIAAHSYLCMCCLPSSTKSCQSLLPISILFMSCVHRVLRLKKIEIQKIHMNMRIYTIYTYIRYSTHKVANFARCKLREHPFQLQLSLMSFVVCVCCRCLLHFCCCCTLDWEKFEVTWLP